MYGCETGKRKPWRGILLFGVRICLLANNTTMSWVYYCCGDCEADVWRRISYEQDIRCWFDGSSSHIHVGLLLDSYDQSLSSLPGPVLVWVSASLSASLYPHHLFFTVFTYFLHTSSCCLFVSFESCMCLDYTQTELVWLCCSVELRHFSITH